MANLRRPVILIIAISLVISFYWLRGPSSFSHATSWVTNGITYQPERDLTDWESTSPLSSLQYVRCFNEFQCARLEVPLDWNSTTASDTATYKVQLAIIKIPAIVPVTDPRYGGVVLFNPGGPGESGVNLLLDVGKDLQTIISSEASLTNATGDVKYFDVLSWDPRGVNNTTPNHGCIGNQNAREVWKIQDRALGSNFSDPVIFDQIWSRYRLLGEVCALQGGVNTVGQDHHLGGFFGTASVIRDMVEIIEQHGKWREEEARRLMQGDSSSATTSLVPDDVLERTAWKQGEEKLLYWGFSYGTVIGEYFASMQPHRIERLLLDGVVDIDDYVAGAWSTNLHDADKIIRELAQQCFNTGPELCPIYNNNGAPQIAADIDSTLKDIASNPLTGVDDNNSPMIITHSMIISKIFDHIYNPNPGFMKIASMMYHASHRNATYFKFLLSPSASAPKDHSTAILSPMCTDTNSDNARSKSQYTDYISKLTHDSPLFAHVWALIVLPCTTYSRYIRAKWPLPALSSISLPYPILFASQRLDPVTPLGNIFEAQKRWPGSGVLNAGGMGHCTASGKSVCAMRAIREYFQRGTLPDEHLDCVRDDNMFKGVKVEDDDWNEDERELMRATLRLGDMW